MNRRKLDRAHLVNTSIVDQRHKRLLVLRHPRRHRLHSVLNLLAVGDVQDDGRERAALVRPTCAFAVLDGLGFVTLLAYPSKHCVACQQREQDEKVNQYGCVCDGMSGRCCLVCD